MTKKLGLILFVFALAVCVGVGLVVYFLGVEGGPEVAEAEPTREPDSTTAEAKVTNVRLPTHLVPVNYKLELVPFIIPDNFSIRGYAEVSVAQTSYDNERVFQIEMECTESAFNITLHAADLEIENDTVTVMEKEGDEVDIFNYGYDLDREFFIVNLNAGLVAGKTYVIKIHYTAYLKDNLKGFYRSVYKDRTTGEEEFIAVTQFQPTDARRAFPCFDEPGIKATYQVEISSK